MIRRVLSTILIVMFVAAAWPKAAFAEDQAQPSPVDDTPQVSALPQPAHTFDLKKATQGVVLQQQSTSARQDTRPFLETGRGKATLAAVLLVAAVVVCYKIVQGPDPTSANAH